MNWERRLQLPRAMAISLIVAWVWSGVWFGTDRHLKWLKLLKSEGSKCNQSSASTHSRRPFLFTIEGLSGNESL